MYRLLALGVTILPLPLILPIAIYAGMCYHWTDTVPKEEDV